MRIESTFLHYLINAHWTTLSASIIETRTRCSCITKTELVAYLLKACPHYETGLMQVEGKPDLSGLNSVSTRPHSIRVDASSVNLNSLGYFKTAKANDNTSTCCQIIGILSATALKKRSWCTRTKRAILDPVSTHFEPTYVCGLAEPGFNPVSQKVGWVRTHNIRVQSGLNPGLRASADMPLYSYLILHKGNMSSRKRTRVCKQQAHRASRRAYLASNTFFVKIVLFGHTIQSSVL